MGGGFGETALPKPAGLCQCEVKTLYPVKTLELLQGLHTDKGVAVRT